MAMTNERKLLLLGLLRRSDMHGYLLNAHLDGTVPISLKKPTAYNLLERMEKDAWVEHRDEPTGDRPRRVYSITRNGEAAFLKLLRQQLGELTPAETPGLVSLSFLDSLPASEATELLEQRRATLEKRRAAFTGKRDDEHSGSMFLAIDYTRRLLDLEAQFLDEVIGHLKSA
jgi:DNA-binding PadR family transcriptional regulator